MRDTLQWLNGVDSMNHITERNKMFDNLCHVALVPNATLVWTHNAPRMQARCVQLKLYRHLHIFKEDPVHQSTMQRNEERVFKRIRKTNAALRRGKFERRTHRRVPDV